MRNIGMVVCYDGTAYYGFQTQPGGNTVQDKLQDAILHLTGEQVKLIGSGRTDAGVHARGQFIQFATASMIPIERWQLALNSRLPEDIVIGGAWELPEGFHAMKSAVRKTYRYTVNNSRVPDVFLRRYQHHYPVPLDLSAMREGIAHLLGEHDFSSFCSRKSTKRSHVRTILEVSIDAENEPAAGGRTRNGVVHISITGTGFLYNMVRIIVGTLLEVGEGKRTPMEIARILESRNRKAAGPTAPAQGLCLWSVEYDTASFT
jgi:tRNA pseudouridine38-40 synthase